MRPTPFGNGRQKLPLIKEDKWQVTLELQTHKLVVNNVGIETKLPMRDWIDIGLFIPAEEGK
ncbi:hypothetical protein [Spirosoma knui]